MKHIPDILGFGGAGLVTAGLWLIHPAAALIGSGSLLVFLGVWKRLESKAK